MRHSTYCDFSKWQVRIPPFLHRKGADVSVRDTKNNSTVHFAAVAYSVDNNKLLLGIKTYVKLTDKDDENPLHISAEFGNLETREAFFFYQRGVVLKKSNKYGDTALMVAVRNGKFSFPNGNRC